jgi:putative hemolysin
MEAPSVAALTTQQLQSMLRGKTGEVWLRARQAIEANDVCGAHLVAHMDSAASLGKFFTEKLTSPLTVFVAEELLALLRNPPADTASPPSSPPSSQLNRLLKHLSKQAAKHAAKGGGSDSDQEEEDDEEEDECDKPDGTVLFRCTDMETGQAVVHAFTCPVGGQANEEEWALVREQVRLFCVSRFGDHAAEASQIRADMLKLTWMCSAVNTRTNARSDFVLSSNDDDALSPDPAHRARFVRSLAFDWARRRDWDVADTQVEVLRLLGLAAKHKYAFFATNRSTGQVATFEIGTKDANLQFGAPAEQQVAMGRVQVHFAQQNGWAVQDVELHMGKKKRVVTLVTNNATGTEQRVACAAVVPLHANSEGAAELEARVLRSIAADVAEQNGWRPADTHAQFTDEPAPGKERKFPYVAHNTRTNEKLHLSVTTQDARATTGTSAQKAQFWNEVAREYVCPCINFCRVPAVPRLRARHVCKFCAHTQDGATVWMGRGHDDGDAHGCPGGRVPHQLDRTGALGGDEAQLAAGQDPSPKRAASTRGGTRQLTGRPVAQLFGKHARKERRRAVCREINVCVMPNRKYG